MVLVPTIPVSAGPGHILSDQEIWLFVIVAEQEALPVA